MPRPWRPRFRWIVERKEGSEWFRLAWQGRSSQDAEEAVDKLFAPLLGATESDPAERYLRVVRIIIFRAD